MQALRQKKKIQRITFRAEKARQLSLNMIKLSILLAREAFVPGFER
jgi:hypothetical protein